MSLCTKKLIRAAGNKFRAINKILSLVPAWKYFEFVIIYGITFKYSVKKKIFVYSAFKFVFQTTMITENFIQISRD